MSAFLALVALAGAALFSMLSQPATAVPPPPAGGYFSLLPAGSFASLPDDATAAAMVRRSSWEPRPENTPANLTTAPATFETLGYSGMKNRAAVFGRVTGNFTGTTDEIIQWAAAKWGLADELLRAQAVAESSWYQNRKDAAGLPIDGNGYGDFGNCGGSPPPSGYGSSGPASFGILQIKWCAMKDATASGYDGWPWSENSTAYNLDFAGAVLRGCLEGWDTWLGNGYVADDMWGCVGRWFAGAWHNDAAERYITRVKKALDAKAWLGWTDYGTTTTTTTAGTTTTTSATTTTTLPADAKAPAVTISNPSDGTKIGTTVTVAATATDDIGVSSMQVTIDGQLMATSSSDSISYKWNAKRASRGAHSITVTAIDAAGNIGSSSVTVSR